MQKPRDVLMNAERWIAGIDLFWASFLSLFFEMLVVRWIPSELGPVAYFSNLMLILAFLGLGAGCLLARARKRLMKAFPFCALLMVSLVLQLAQWRIRFSDASTVFVHGAGVGNATEPSTEASIHVVLAVLSPLVVGCFLCLGQELGKRLSGLRPLSGYAINLLGSMAGIVAFVWIGWRRLPPAIWFSLAAAVTLWLLRDSRRNLLVGGLALAATLLCVVPQESTVYWSPYYRIRFTPIYDEASPQRRWFGNVVDVNTTFHQYHLDLSGRLSDPPGWETTPFIAFYREIYDLPYQVQSPGKVLVLGAGGGNDVAAALRYGAEAVDAVEIDPVIAELGRRHPEQPYADARVRLIIDDARSFLRKSHETYDVIVFGFLDTIRLLSELSSVRLESYVYTRESLREVKRHLAPDGLIVLAFSTTTEWMLARHVRLLADAFGQRPEVYTPGRSTVLLLAPGRQLPVVATTHLKRLDPQRVEQLARWPVPVPTDDWPFLYMERRGIPWEYVVVLAGTMMLALVLVSVVGPAVRELFPWPFFFLGAGFMLLEALTITRLARFFGSTWAVTSIVVFIILAMALLANGVAARCAGIPRYVVHSGLGIMLLIAFGVEQLTGWCSVENPSLGVE